MTGEPALRLIVQGHVQRVGFRWWAVETARRLGVRGWVRNRADGSVEILAIGPVAQLNALAEACRSGPAAAKVAAMRRDAADDDGTMGFEQLPSA
ncbi:MAG: acylphosphatase [Aliidongia sp.]|jgi:acylphosphatase|nr:acylphosphatase [Aliidongia sp.]